MGDLSVSDGIKWLTYDEASVVLRIKPDSVRRRASLRKWQRMQGNDGLARIGVPLDIIPDDTTDASPVIIPAHPDNPDTQTDENLLLARIEIASLQAKVQGLEARLSDTQGERDRIAGLLDKALEARAPTGILRWLFRG